jgi:hypothetical protein
MVVAPTAGSRLTAQPTPARRRLWWAALLVPLLIGLLTKEPELLLPIGPDQGTYSYVAERILAGGLPYVDAWDNKPPATYYAHAAVLALVPSDERWSRSCLPGVQQECGYLALQLADVAWTSATGLALVGVARALGWSPAASLVSSGLFLLFANLSQLSREGSTPEKQLLLPMTLAYLAALRWWSDRRLGWLYAAGALAGVAFLFKQTAVSIPLALVACWVWRRGAPRLSAVLAFGLGWLAPFVLTAAVFAARGGLAALWDASFAYNVVQAGSSALLVPRGLLSGAWHVFANSSALLWLLGLGGALLAVQRGPRLTLAVCWAIADAVSLALGGSKFAQVYFVQLVPSLALLGGYALVEGWSRTRGQPLLRGYAAVVGLAVFLLSNQFQASVVLRAWWERTPPHASVPLERLLAGRLRIDDGSLFVWGDNSEIYLYAHARAPGRFFHTFPLTHQYTSGSGSLERRAELLRTWHTVPPSVVAIDPAAAREDPDGSAGLNPSSFPELEAMLAARYTPMDGLPGGWRAYRLRIMNSELTLGSLQLDASTR